MRPVYVKECANIDYVCACAHARVVCVCVCVCVCVTIKFDQGNFPGRCHSMQACRGIGQGGDWAGHCIGSLTQFLKLLGLQNLRMSSPKRSTRGEVQVL